MEGVNLNIGPNISNSGAAAKVAKPSNLTDFQRKQIHKSAQDFEAVFISEMMRPVFEMQKSDPYTGGGQQESYYRSMLVDEYGKSMSRRGGIGIANHVEKELLKLQEAHNGN